MTTVYLVKTSSFVHGVFSSKDEAHRYINSLGDTAGNLKVILAEVDSLVAKLYKVTLAIKESSSVVGAREPVEWEATVSSVRGQDMIYITTRTHKQWWYIEATSEEQAIDIARSNLFRELKVTQ